MSDQTAEPEANPPQRPYDRDAMLRTVNRMLYGADLTVRAFEHEVVVFNPYDPEKGEVRIEFESARVSWKRIVWDYWGALQGYEAEGHDGAPYIGADRIISTLCPNPRL